MSFSLVASFVENRTAPFCLEHLSGASEVNATRDRVTART